MDIISSLSTIKNFMGNASRTSCNEYLYDALTEAVQCMEKQIPKKPISGTNNDRVPRLLCPTCGYQAFTYGNSKYCVSCGQVIDWSKE